jgi:hypothetical protein
MTNPDKEANTARTMLSTHLLVPLAARAISLVKSEFQRSEAVSSMSNTRRERERDMNSDEK